MKKTITLLLVLSLFGCSYRQLQTGLVVGAMADVATTQMCLGTERAVETNPIYRDGFIVNTMIRAALTGLQLYVGDVLYKWKPIIGELYLLGANAVNIFIVGNNMAIYVGIKIKY